MILEKKYYVDIVRVQNWKYDYIDYKNLGDDTWSNSLLKK